mmetsp:Transcript_4355/g.7451  ORF Transcript_4355/g.7451 Transcript_4355/m.7451 type:complete len:172 (-) Transcript_4355:76-591(-)
MATQAEETVVDEAVQKDILANAHKLLGVTEEEYRTTPRWKEVHDYLQQHCIHQLFNGLLAQAALERPPDLRTYLVQVLTEMKNNKSSPSIGFFTAEDLSTMFDMWDVAKTGTLLPSQVAETLKAINSDVDVEQVAQSLIDQGVTTVDKEAYVNIVRSELERFFSPLATQKV